MDFMNFEFFDEEGWPHYRVKEELPPPSGRTICFDEGGHR
jgi:hypothetical protein